MSDKTHTLVLGAGASAAYNYPVTEGLVNAVSKLLLSKSTHVKERVELAHFLHYNNNPESQFNIDTAFEAILDITPDEVSADQLVRTFKDMILHKVLDYEVQIDPNRPVEEFFPLYIDWVFALVKFLNGLKFDLSSLSVKTFNYDDSFEHFFYMHSHYLRAPYCDFELDIEHLHGDVRKGMLFKEKAFSYGTRAVTIDTDQEMFTRSVASRGQESQLEPKVGETKSKIFFLGVNYEIEENLKMIASKLGIDPESKSKDIHIFIYGQTIEKAEKLCEKYMAENADKASDRVFPYGLTRWHPISQTPDSEGLNYVEQLMRILDKHWNSKF